MTQHIVRAYDDELAQLKTMISQMGGLAEEALAQSLDALSQRNVELADEVITRDAKIDALELEVEERAIQTIAKRQPMALDLRQIMVSIRIASDLERIGDLAKNIAKRTLAMTAMVEPRIMKGLVRMGQLALGQLKDVLDSFGALDAEKAIEVWRSDEDIDAIYNSVFRELLTYMMEDPRMIGMSTHLLFAAKNIERIGDHCTNIAENIHYLVKGTQLAEARPKKDQTSTMPVEDLQG